MTHTKVTHRIDRMTGRDWCWKCRHGDCHAQGQHKSRMACITEAEHHQAYHAARWAA